MYYSIETDLKFTEMIKLGFSASDPDFPKPEKELGKLRFMSIDPIEKPLDEADDVVLQLSLLVNQICAMGEENLSRQETNDIETQIGNLVYNLNLRNKY